MSDRETPRVGPVQYSHRPLMQTGDTVCKTLCDCCIGRRQVFMTTKLLLGFALLLSSQIAVADYAGWQHIGSLWILTTPEGADLPPTCSESDFPLLIRLNGSTFNFSEAEPGGEDLRFSDSKNAPLAYQIEHWDAAHATASIWVRIPLIKGNDRQRIQMHWGKPIAISESSGTAVFNADNGFCSVIHMGKSLQDEVGSTAPVDAGSTLAPGIIGEGRHCIAGTGIACGDAIQSFPSADNAFSSAVWFRAEACGGTVLGWGRYATRLNGKTGDGNEVLVNIGSPPSLSWTSDGPGGANASTAPVLGEWCHVVATYANGTSQIYANGKPDGLRFHKGAMSLMDSVSMLIGGGRPRSYNFVGSIDEVRISKVARSADWIALEYQNQKTQQTLVGAPVVPGQSFAVSHERLTVLEGESATITAQAGGAQKVSWILDRDGVQTVVAVDRLAYQLAAGRVQASTSLSLQFKAVYANETKTHECPVTILEDIPEPVVALSAPPTWNGRDLIEVVPTITNLPALRAKGAATLSYKWTISGGAVIKAVAADRLFLKRSQYTGNITVEVAVDNGGAATLARTTIAVIEPQNDPWIERVPEFDEQPEDHQFIARDSSNRGTLFYNGTLDHTAEMVFLNVLADGKPYTKETQQLTAEKGYAFTIKLKPGLIKYTVNFGTQTGGKQAVLRTVSDIVCGDAYAIQGQSNAEATGPNNGPPPEPTSYQSDWIRSYGNAHDGTPSGGWGRAVRTRLWGASGYGFCQIGTWGIDLARHLVERHKMPICILNGAVGGTRIDQHQPNPKDHADSGTIYGRLLTRIKAAKLSHGIRGVLWHQGENNQGSAAPTGDYDWKSYQQYFVDLSAAWKTDCPNIRHYYIYQIWPNGCNMGGTQAGDMVLEMQRTLPALYSNMRIMSTVGIVSPAMGRGMCHFDPAGYAQLATLMEPLLEQDNYGVVLKQAATAPNLKQAAIGDKTQTEITLDFGQPMIWNAASQASLYLDDKAAAISTGAAMGNTIVLQLTAPTTAKTISYLKGRDWNGTPEPLLRGANGIAALTFCEVPLREVEAAPLGYHVRTVEGWRVCLADALFRDQPQAVETALSLLQKQLAEIVRVVPANAVATLRDVTLWFSAEYPGVPAQAEYHPAAGWLRGHGRNPAMEKGVEFTNVLTFARETERMPNFVLHELAHAYHDRVLSFQHPDVVGAYDHAKAANLYERVERWHGNGKPNTTERAYAMTNAAEYFAETSEAFFSRNDFFPFNREELKQHDPQIFVVLQNLWGVGR